MKPTTIAVASGKGGTGKTLISTSMVSVLSESIRVVLVDLDVEEPNAHVFFPKPENTTVEEITRAIPRWLGDCSECKLCASLCRFGAIVTFPKKVMVIPELCHGCHLCADMCGEGKLEMTTHKTGTASTWQAGRFTVLEGRLNIGEESGTRLIQAVHNRVQEKFASCLCIVDCPPGTSCHVIEALKPADYVILVTEPTPFGAHDLRLALDLSSHMGIRAGVVVNRDGIGDADIDGICSSYRVPVIAKIAESRTIAAAYAEGIHPITVSSELQSATRRIQEFLQINVIESMVLA